MRPHRKTVRLAAFCSVFNKFWDLAPPLLIGLAVDVVFFGGIRPSRNRTCGPLAPTGRSFGAYVSYLGFGILFETFTAFSGETSLKRFSTIRLDTFDHIQQQGMAWFDERQK